MLPVIHSSILEYGNREFPGRGHTAHPWGFCRALPQMRASLSPAKQVWLHRTPASQAPSPGGGCCVSAPSIPSSATSSPGPRRETVSVTREACRINHT